MNPTPGAQTQRRSLPLVIAGLVLVVGGAAAWWGMRGDSHDVGDFDVAAQVPKDAVAVAWTGPLVGASDGLQQLGSAVPGLTGVADAARLGLGLRELSADGLSQVGLSAGHGAVAFHWQQAQWLVMPIVGEGGALHLLELAHRRGHASEALPQDGERRGWALRSRDGRSVIGHLWQLGPKIVVRASFVDAPDGATPTDADPSALQQWLSAERLPAKSLDDKGGQLHVRWNIGEHDPLRRRIRRVLGPASLLFGRYVGSFSEARADVRLGKDRVGIRARLQAPKDSAAEIARYHFNFIDSDDALMDLGGVLPDEVSALVRARINPKLVAMVSGLLAMGGGLDLGAVDPVLRTVDANPLFLDMFGGQVADALLGVSDEATPSPRQWLGYGWRKLAGLAIAVTLRDDTAARAAVDRIRGRLDEDKAAHETLTLGAWAGLKRKGRRGAWALLRHKRHILFVLGDGELARFERVQSGRFPSLGASLKSDLERSAVNGKTQWLSTVVTTGRTVRSARRRGIPDAITAMIDSVAAVSAGVQLLDDGAQIEVQLRPAAQPQGAGQ